MGFLENFEKGLERIVTGAFSKTFKSELQPIEIAAAIKSEMDSKASIVSRDRIIAPNTYSVRLSAADFQRMRALGANLITELTNLTQTHAIKQGFQFGAALDIKLVEDGSLNLGQIVVASATEEIAVTWSPALDLAGKRYLLTASRTSVGRDASADIQIDDSGLSRKHFEILWDGSKAGIRDLGSTNGTKVDGRAMSESPLQNESRISAGRSEFVFRIVANKVSNE
ncbi:MAG: hypothetical protein RIR29_291 [Actinomycetota bacterium]